MPQFPSPSGNEPRRTRKESEPLPQTREVAPGIWKITLPIPFPLRSVNVYALVGRDGWVLIDAGIGTPHARAAFQHGLEHIGLALADLQAIVLTHHHPDHIGLSGELQKQTGTGVYMHPLDEVTLQVNWSGSLPERFSRVSNFFVQHGLPYTELWYAKVDPAEMRLIISVPPHEAFTLLEDGQEIELAGEHYKVFWVPGHSNGLVSLFRERDGIFLSSDHVLPGVTPHVGLYSQDGTCPNPLGDYLDSLSKVANLPATLVLPGHGESFTDLPRRTSEIMAHHDERLKYILSLLREQPQHAHQLAEQLFPRRLANDETRRMAVAEVLSHLECLRYREQVKQLSTEDGLILYTLV